MFDCGATAKSVIGILPIEKLAGVRLQPESGGRGMGWLDWIPSWLLNYGSFEETENEDLAEIGIVAGYNVAAALVFWLYWTCEEPNPKGRGAQSLGLWGC